MNFHLLVSCNLRKKGRWKTVNLGHKLIFYIINMEDAAGDQNFMMAEQPLQLSSPEQWLVDNPTRYTGIVAVHCGKWILKLENF